jgi:sugar phosphate isomerase/epimerase
VVLAGLPEGAPGDTCPCWIVDSFQPYAREALRWQWEERLIPYWREHAKIAQDHGCTLCFEPQIGDMIHSPSTFMRIREAIGPIAGCNLDPSHLFVQQIDVLEVIRFLGNAIYHVHIKDTRIDPCNLRLKGLLDTTSYCTPDQRAWTFTLIGWGHDQKFWRDFITNLRLVGYDGVLSVENETEYINVIEGLEKTIRFLKPMILEKHTGTCWWEHLDMQL